MSVGESIRFDEKEKKGKPVVFSEASRVDLNYLLKRLKEEEKKTKRSNLAISAAAISTVVVFGIILTL